MKQYPFIFSDKRAYRLQRHFMFWLVWWLSQGFLYSFVAINIQVSYWVKLPSSIAESLVFLVAHIFLAYSLMYFVIPRFLLQQRYWLTAAWVVLLFFMTACMSVLLSSTAIPLVRGWMLTPGFGGVAGNMRNSIFYSLLAGLRGAITVGGIAAAIKLMKYWYVKEQRNLQLQNENAESQLKMLKAQVHPHFLFNTLNNIYSYTQTLAPMASKMVLGLSDMLRYMLYECNRPVVPLAKEIKLLKDYCLLEQVRYDHHLDLQMDIPHYDRELYIAPLILLPFVENCFKHGASNMIEKSWVSLGIYVEGNCMKMKLLNNKPAGAQASENTGTGIGIANVLARLELLYAGKYELAITNEGEIFIVNLSIQLDNQLVPPAISTTAKKTIKHAKL